MNARGLTFGVAMTCAWFALLATGIGCVWAKHEARTQFIELRALERERDRLEIEWGRLRIEQSAWATHSRVENLAREELGMVVPRAADTAVLKPLGQ